MIRFLATVALGVLANAAGLFLASLILDGVSITLFGFSVSVLLFTVASLVLSPFILKVSIRYMPALSGGVALVTTFVSLFLTTLLTDGLRIEGLVTWILAPLVVWLSVVVASVVLPLFLFKKALGRVAEKKQPAETLPKQ